MRRTSLVEMDGSAVRRTVIYGRTAVLWRAMGSLQLWHLVVCLLAVIGIAGLVALVVVLARRR
jgi:hypothetical protein